MQQLKKMGPLGGLLGMMPGMPKELKGAKIDDDDLKPIEAIIRSMTPEERAKPEIINGSRRNRIALGSGTTPRDINRLVKQFSEMQKMMKRFGMAGGMARARRASGARRSPGCPASAVRAAASPISASWPVPRRRRGARRSRWPGDLGRRR